MIGLMRRLRALRRDQEGASALEFALLAPVFIAGFFGLVETGQVILAGRRTSHAAGVLGDLITQKQSVTTSDIADSFAAGAQMMTPMATTSLKMKVTSVTEQSDGTIKVDWSKGYQGLVPDVQGAVYNNPAAAGLLTSAGDSMVIATANYTLLQASSYMLANNLGFTRVFYAKPRSGSTVTCPTC